MHLKLTPWPPLTAWTSEMPLPAPGNLSVTGLWGWHLAWGWDLAFTVNLWSCGTVSFRELEPPIGDLPLGQSQWALTVLSFQPLSSLDTIQRVFRKQTNPIKMSMCTVHVSLRFLKDPKHWNGLSFLFVLSPTASDRLSEHTRFNLLAPPPFS